MGKLVLIDGNSIANRAFYGVPDLTNSQGLHTNAVYGFLNIMFKILSEENPDYLAVAFDLHAPTFRHKMYEAYKGTRKPMPSELKEQMPYLKQLLEAMNIRILELEGYEADDLLGTMAKRTEAMGHDVSLVSGDRDLLQIATDRILIRIPKTKGGKTEIENYHTKDVIEKYSLRPLQIIELKALMGDSSDNIPGVPKVGEKTATALLTQYDNIENLYEHIDEISKNVVRETIKANFDMAVLSKKLATIDIDAPIEVSLDDMKMPEIYTKEAYAIIKMLGFKNFAAQFENTADNGNSNIEENFRIIEDFSEAEEILNKCVLTENMAFRLLTEDREILGISICLSDSEIYYIPVQGFVGTEYLIGKLVNIISQRQSGMISTYDLKSQLHYIGQTDMETAGKYMCDCLIAAYLINPLKNDYDIEDIAGEHLSLVIKGYKERFDKQGIKSAYEKDPVNVRDYACYCAYVCYKSSTVMVSKLKEYDMYTLFTDIEMPLCVVLYRMEAEGILVRPEELHDYSVKLAGELETLEQSIYEDAGEKFNINSPKQLGEILFEKMNIPGGKKTKTGYSTAADVLEKLSADYPFVDKILRYRTVSKLKSTYADGLVPYIDDNNRIHSTFNQTITATGRISSTEPNLQNIPIRMEEGRLIRKVFVPKEGCVFVDADYSQIELRLMAHMSGDEKLIEAYKRADDIHAITASEVFHVPLSEVTPTLRRNAKAVNFGIIYGISSFGLSSDLSISRKEAADYIERYFETYPGVKAFIDGLVASAKEKGYAVTMFNRRRPIPELSSNVFMQRSFGERVAMNAPIQGTAADIMKIAMINVMRRMDELKLKSRLLLQVHDELLIETYEDEIDTVKSVLEEEMCGACELRVALEIDMQEGRNWYDAK